MIEHLLEAEAAEQFRASISAGCFCFTDCVARHAPKVLHYITAAFCVLDLVASACHLHQTVASEVLYQMAYT